MNIHMYIQCTCTCTHTKCVYMYNAHVLLHVHVHVPLVGSDSDSTCGLVSGVPPSMSVSFSSDADVESGQRDAGTCMDEIHFTRYT